MRRAEPDPRREVGRGASEPVREPRRQHPGIDGTEDLVAERDSREYRHAEHVSDLTPAERAPGLLDEHGSQRAGERRRAYGPAQRQVAAADDGNVASATSATARRGGFVRATTVDDNGVRSVAQCHRQRRPATASGRAVSRRDRPAERQQRHAWRHLDREPVERLGGRLRSGGEPIEQTQLGFGTEAEDRGLVAVEIGEPAPGRQPTRASTSASDAARTDVPEPPFGDHNASSIANLLPEARGTRAVARRKCKGRDRTV